MLSFFKTQGVLPRILLSHDAGWYHVGEAGGGEFRPFVSLFTSLLPALKERGFTSEELERLTVHNPREAFGLCVRKAP